MADEVDCPLSYTFEDCASPSECLWTQDGTDLQWVVATGQQVEENLLFFAECRAFLQMHL